MLGTLYDFKLSADCSANFFFFFNINCFERKISGMISECQMVWNNIFVGPDSSPNCLQRKYQQKTLAGKGNK